MSVVLLVVSCLCWVCKLIGIDEFVLFVEVEVFDVDVFVVVLLFLFYLLGECMLYNDLYV